jgi:hypothetical protein
MNHLFTKKNFVRLTLALALAGWLFVKVNVLFSWEQYTSIYWGTAKVSTWIQHPFSSNPKDSEFSLLDYYRFQSDDSYLEFPSYHYGLAKDDVFSIEYTSPYTAHWDQKSYLQLVEFSISYQKDFRSLSVSNDDGLPTIIKCHYGELGEGCQKWTPADGWTEFWYEG